MKILKFYPGSFVRGMAGALLATAFALLNSAFADQIVNLQFIAEVDGKSFECGQEYTGIGTSNVTIIPADFRLYLFAVALIDSNKTAVPIALEQDGIWQYQDVALLDFENGSGPCQNGNEPINMNIRGTVPDGDYQGLEFTLGLPFELNHADNLLAASPLNLSAMFWNWQGGYRFFKVDISANAANGSSMGMEGRMHGAASGEAGPGQINPGVGGGMGAGMHQIAGGAHGNAGYLIHLGSTGCASSSATTAPAAGCVNPNLVPVSFASFNPAVDTIAIDIAPLLRNNDLNFNTPGTPQGCMSGINDPECTGIFQGFGLDGSEQKLFSVK